MALWDRKKPKRKEKPQPAKDPKAGANVGGTDAENPSWRFSILDVEGPFGEARGWGLLGRAALVDLITARIRGIEASSWNDLKRAGSHGVELYKLAKEARDRLEALGLDDIETLFTLRVSGRERIWGIRDRAILKILWWDPEHEVCVSLKKHT